MIFGTQPWVERLGLTLLHFLWQGVIVAAIYAAARSSSARGTGPNARYLLACAALTAMVIAPLITWLMLGPPAPASAAITFSAPLSVRTEPAGVIAPLPIDATNATSLPLLPWVVAIWFAGATVFSLRLFATWILAERLRFKSVRPAPAPWQTTFHRLKNRVAVSRPVRLLISGALHTPAAIGWLSPVVLVPVGALTGLPAAQIEALLIHELAHIRRHDYLLNILQSAVEAVFFYHPAVWWISGHMRTERELCCDDIAVSLTGDAVAYALALAEFDSARWLQPAVMAANGASLASRIARLLGQSAVSPRSAAGPASATLILFAIGGCLLLAQPADRPRFEVASIKQSVSRSVQNVRPLPGRLTADATLQTLIPYAYAVQPFQVTGGPAFLQSQRYQIDAKADGSASRDRMYLMLRSLLEDRFGLKTRRETRDLPVYTLVAAKGGIKLPSPTESACVQSAADASPEWVGGGRMAAPGELPPGRALCGSAAISLGAEGASLHGEKVTMPELVRALSRLLGRPVIDRTGATGLFDLRVAFVPDETTPAMPPPPPDAGMSGPSIIEALRQQLGLQLESTKGPVEVIVVDHAEPPTAN